MSASDDARLTDGGFTLIELLVTIAITAIILSAVTISVTMGFQRTADAERRTDRSNVSEFTARYFTGDAASSAVDQDSVVACPGSGAVVSMAGSDGRTTTYSRRLLGTEWTVVRTVCTGPTLVSTNELGSSTNEFTASGTCPTGSTAQCTLSVTWPNGDGDFTLTGTRRAS
jgi:prepilin-type N-terminal cleavage/methylation domain-containing protein